MSWHKLRFKQDDKKLRFDCIVCGIPMWFPKSKHGKYKTCSDKCKLEKEFNQKDIRTKPCVTCGKLFTPRNIQLKLGHGNYCSQACNKSYLLMNTPEAQKKAVANAALTRLTRPYSLKAEKNPRWNGGKKAAIERNKPKLALYKKINKDKVNVWNQNRRKKTIGKLSVNIVEKLKIKQSNQCAICLNDLIKYHIDHVIPISKGGLNIDSNVQLTCIPCNLKKGNKLITELERGAF